MSACKILLFLLLALCVLCGECEVLYGQSRGEIYMECKVPSNSDTEWKFNGELIIHINGKRGVQRKGKIPVTKKAQIYGEGLKIIGLEAGDSGVYSCTQKQYTVHVVSFFVKPGPVLFQSSDAELHCITGGSANTEVHWLRPPNNEKHDEGNQIIHLKSVTSKEEGQWTCVVNDFKFNVTLTVVGLQTKAVEVSAGGNIDLPCSLSSPVSQRVLGGKWKAEHLPGVSFPTLKNTEDKGLHWDGKNSSKVTFTSGKLSTRYDVTLRNVQPSDEGTYVCTVEFEGGVKLTAKMDLTVTSKPKGEGQLTKTVFGLQLWIWIIVGVLSVVLLGLIILTALVYKRNKRMKRRKKLRQSLAAREYCQCKRYECEVGQQQRPLPVPRQQRNPRTAGPNHMNEY